jgi:hypothetical protein
LKSNGHLEGAEPWLPKGHSQQLAYPPLAVPIRQVGLQVEILEIDESREEREGNHHFPIEKKAKKCHYLSKLFVIR